MESNMEVIITGSGTSQGVPVIGCDCKVCKSHNPKDKRLRSSVHITYKNKSIVIDTGKLSAEDVFSQISHLIDSL